MTQASKPLAELHDRKAFRIGNRNKLECMVKTYLAANNGPHVEGHGVGRNREPQLHQASNRDWLGQLCAQSTLGDDEAVPVKVALYVIANSQGQIGTIPGEATLL